MACEVLLSPIPSVARLSLQHLDLRQDLFLRFLDVGAQLLPVDVMLPLPNRGPCSFCRRSCKGVGPVVPNAVRFGDFARSPGFV
eukprot:3579093-Heterocapsa_arctica.AAC.1